MKFDTEVVLACLISFIWIQQSLCDKVSNTSVIQNWTCKCSLPYQGNQSDTIQSNCATSCNCSQDDRSTTIWTCICSADRLPKVAADSYNTNCFSACNCTSGTIGCFQRNSCFFGDKAGTIHGAIIQFSYSELQNATEKFSNPNLIGVGGSSYVYRGELKDRRIVAVKRLKNQNGTGADAVFLTEIELLSRLHHCHVVPLVGYCSESHRKPAERLLVFEYMPNGNLRDCLDGALGKKLDWGTRVAIAIGAARGLEYLHDAAAPRILHRDVKSTNILLDENWRAKITDLGMAKHLKADGISSCSSSPARMQGTFGYFAPEYAIVGRASIKSDVFSFGVVLLELITGRQPIHKLSGKGEESLVIWATPRLQDSRRVITELPDPRLNGKFPEDEMQIMAYLAKECLLLDPEARPTMSEVVQILSTIAPERSRRTNIPINFYQRSPAYGIKGEHHIERPDLSPLSSQEMHVGVKDSEELRRVLSRKLSARCSLPLDIERTLCVENNNENTLSAECVERLILLTLKARSGRASDDEAVDITEPRFEAFCMGNVYSPGHTTQQKYGA